MSQIGRGRIIEALHRSLENDPAVLAAWLGGSDASGRTDEHSDVDLVCVVRDDAVETAFSAVEAALAGLGPIAHRMRLPEPTWHGHAQSFYLLANAHPDHVVDLVVIRHSSDGWLLEPERHGRPLVLFDRAGLLDALPALDRDAHDARVAARRAELPARFALFQSLVTRAIARGHAAEAVERYVSFTLRPLVELLRIGSCPERFDYGLRYLDRDLAPADRERIEQLAFPRDLDHLTALHAEAAAWFAALTPES